MSKITDVARKAGVSVATVSRVINNKGYIHEETREKVLKIIKELNYQPNEVARSLYSRSSKFIGLIIPTIDHPFFSELAFVIENKANSMNYKVLLCNSQVDFEKEKDYIEMLTRSQVAGIIMASQNLELDYYKNLKLPIISLERQIFNDIPYVVSDNYQGGLLATRRLLDGGCRYLAHISGNEGIKPAFQRTQAFKDLLDEKGIPYIIEKGEFDYNKILVIAEKIMTEHPEVDGIFAGSDVGGAAVMKVAVRLGRRIPDDLQIVGFDGVSIAKMLPLELTTIRQPVDKLGEAAVDLLISKIEGDQDVKWENKIFPVELIEGDTTR